MPSPIAQHGVLLNNTFDPYVANTVKAAPTGIYEDGVDLCNIYADIRYGSAAAATGIRSRNVDLNAIFAKRGTASYGLSINGKSYTANSTSAGSVSSATLQFVTNNSGFSVVDTNRSPSTLASGAIPTGATQCRVTTTLTSGTPANVFNQLSSFVGLTGTSVRTEVGNLQDESGQPEIRSTYNLKIEYRNSSNVVISTSSVGFTVDTNHT